MGTASAFLGVYEACALRDALTEWLGYTLPTVRHAPTVSGDPGDAALGGEEVSRCADRHGAACGRSPDADACRNTATEHRVDHTATDGTTW